MHDLLKRNGMKKGFFEPAGMDCHGGIWCENGVSESTFLSQAARLTYIQGKYVLEKGS
jgi:hypothetical protein